MNFMILNKKIKIGMNFMILSNTNDISSIVCVALSLKFEISNLIFFQLAGMFASAAACCVRTGRVSCGRNRTSNLWLCHHHT